MGFFDKKEALVGLDIGSNAIKLVELETSENVPKLVNIGILSLSSNIFSGNSISNMEVAAEQITSLLEANDVTAARAAVAVPSPGVFTKKIQMAKLSRKDLQNTIELEANNYIPHSIDAVKLDYHVISEDEKGKLNVLLVAVKNEVVDSFLNTMALTGLDTVVCDIDYFALQNMFEVNYPDLINETVALLNIGARYTSINVCRGGDSLFTGDVSLGGRALTEQIMEATGLSYSQAEESKFNNDEKGEHYGVIEEIIDKNTTHIASELNRQLSFFWNAAGANESIDRIMIAGGAALAPRLTDELSEKTGIECGLIDSLNQVECNESFDTEFLREVSPKMSVAVGVALRDVGDKIFNVDLG